MKIKGRLVPAACRAKPAGFADHLEPSTKRFPSGSLKMT
jgi:hypothetical protein